MSASDSHGIVMDDFELERAGASDPAEPSAEVTDDRVDYWDKYYATSTTRRRPLPSQFAAFVAGELTGPSRVIELGCGAGRDAIFFAANGHQVIGVDASEQAVARCRVLAGDLDEDARFIAAAIDDAQLPGTLGTSPDPVVVYARFFVHAITDEEEVHFLDLAASVTNPGDLLAVEYRTVRDSSGSKVTGRHYRRFVRPSLFQNRALARGFEVTYSVEGFGFAKYKSDDAYVARTIFVKL